MVLPENGPTGALGPGKRKTHDLASVVDGVTTGGQAHKVPSRQAEVLHTFRSGPQEGMNGAVGKLRRPDHLASVIDTGSNVRGCASEAAEVSGRAIFFPEHGVRARRVHRRQRGVGAQTRRADGLPVVIDAEGEPDGVALEGMEFLDPAVWSPLHGFEVENLKRRCR